MRSKIWDTYHTCRNSYKIQLTLQDLILERKLIQKLGKLFLELMSNLRVGINCTCMTEEEIKCLTMTTITLGCTQQYLSHSLKRLKFTRSGVAAKTLLSGSLITHLASGNLLTWTTGWSVTHLWSPSLTQDRSTFLRSQFIKSLDNY